MSRRKMRGEIKAQKKKYAEQLAQKVPKCGVCGFMPAHPFGGTFFCKAHLPKNP